MKFLLPRYDVKKVSVKPWLMLSSLGFVLGILLTPTKLISADIVSHPLQPLFGGEYSNLGLSNQQVADDFLLTQTTTLESLSWFGRYDQRPNTTNPFAFSIRLYSDTGGNPAVTPFQQVNVAVDAVPTGLEYNGRSGVVPWFSYSTPLPSLTLDPGLYWLSIVEDEPQTPTSGSSQWLWGDTASVGLRAYRSRDGARWTTNTDIDHAFTFNGTVVTKPTTPPVVSNCSADDNPGLYWTTFTSGATSRVQSSNLDGSNTRDLITGLDAPWPIEIDSQHCKMYFADVNTNIIRRANLDGSDMETINVGVRLDGPSGLAIDPVRNDLYWSDFVLNRILKTDLDTNTTSVLVSAGLENPFGLALDLERRKLYWADTGVGSPGKIQRSNLDGTNVEDLVTGLTNPRDVAMDFARGHLFWPDLSDGAIYRSNLDGSDAAIWLRIGSGSHAVAIDPASETLYWTTNRDGVSSIKLDGSDLRIRIVPRANQYGVAIHLPQPNSSTLRGDFNGDGPIDVVDLNLLGREITQNTHSPFFDLNGDKLVNQDDLNLFLDGNIIPDGNRVNGDADFDGTVAFVDFLILSASFGQDGKTWSQGDFIANGRVDFNDFLVLSANIGKSADSVTPVPEPHTGMRLVVGLSILVLLRYAR